MRRVCRRRKPAAVATAGGQVAWVKSQANGFSVRRFAMANSEKSDQEIERLPLTKAAQFLLDECRMVLPGIQCLFGFQLIVVFSTDFSTKLSVPEQHLHLLAIGLIAIAVALIMTPAAYHRQAGSRHVSKTLVRMSSRMLL